jgi:hypothetical protein
MLVAYLFVLYCTVLTYVWWYDVPYTFLSARKKPRESELPFSIACAARQ